MRVYGEIAKVQAENLASDPSNAPSGRFFFDTALKVLKIFDQTSWAKLVGRVVSGSRGTPTNVTAAGGLAVVAGGADQLWFIQGYDGAIAAPVTVTANPRISVGSFVGQKLLLKGRSDTNYVLLPNGQGMSLQGDWFGGEDSTLGLTWDGTNWSEDFRR